MSGIWMSISTTSGWRRRTRSIAPPVAGLAADRDARLALEDRAEAGADEHLVVGDEDRDLGVELGRGRAGSAMRGPYLRAPARRIIPWWDARVARGGMTRRAARRSVRRVDRAGATSRSTSASARRSLAYGLPPMLDAGVNDPARPSWDRCCCRPCWCRSPAAPASAGGRAALAAGCVVSALPTFDQFRLVVAVPVALLVLFSLARSPRRGPRGGRSAGRPGRAGVRRRDRVGAHGRRRGRGMMAFATPLCLAVWGAGRIVRSRERVAAQLTERSEQLRRQREATAALAVEIDRVRLASDLDLAARWRLQEMIGLASCKPSGRLRPGRGSRGSSCWAASRWTRCARCSGCCAASTAGRARPVPRSSSSMRCWPSARRRARGRPGDRGRAPAADGRRRARRLPHRAARAGGRRQRRRRSR